MTGLIEISPVVAAGGSITVFFSDNHGMDWKEVAKIEQSGNQKVAFTDNVFNRYDYRLKFVMKGAGTGLNGLKIVNDIQHSQAVMPLILEGENKISFSAGAPEGTITFEGHMSNTGRNLGVMDFHPELDGLGKNNLGVLSGKGTAIFTMKTPGHITRFRMNAHYRARDYEPVYLDLKSEKLRDYYDVEVSFDAGKTWKKVTRLDRGQPASSKYVEFTDIPRKSREMLVRFSGVQNNTTRIFDLRMDADYRELDGGFRPVKITYVWTENDEEKTHSHIATKPQETWTIHCGPGTVAKSYTMELAK